MSPAELAIETHALSKSFGRQTAVAELALAVPRGSVFGFLGPNGSGKTTTIRMLLGLSSPTAGQISVLGRRIPDAAAEVLPRVGALVEGPAFYPFLSGRENLRRFDTANRHAASTTRSARIDAALERVGLSHAARKAAHAYSLGMKQRLGLANALLMPRDLLVLDEPTNGLDPQGTREVRSLIRSLADEGTTVFLSSHLLAEVEQVCTHVAVMSTGRLVAQGSLDELRAHGGRRVIVTTPDVTDARRILAQLGLEPDAATAADAAGAAGAAVGRTDAAPEAVLGAELPPGFPPESVTAALVHGGVRVRAIAVERASLEDRFVALTGEGFDVAE